MKWKSPFCAVLLAMACVQVAMFSVIQVRNVGWPYSGNYAEGHVLWMTMQMADRHLAYQPLDRMPWVLYPYTPLYMLTVRLLSHLAGDLLAVGRSLSVASTLAIGLVVGMAVFLCLPRRAPALWRLASAGFAGTQFLLLESVRVCAPLMRVDMLALLVSFAGLAVFILAGRRPMGQYVAVALFVLAVFTKQTMLPIPLACLAVGLWLDWRQAVRAYAFGVVLGMAGLAFFSAYFGSAFLKHILFYNTAPFSLQHALFQISWHFHQNLALTAVGVAACFGIWKRRARFTASLYDRAVLVGGVHLALATAWLITIGKQGSDINYFLEWDIGCCFLAGLFVYRLLATWKATRVPSPVAAVSYLLIPAIALFAITTTLQFVFPSAVNRAILRQHGADAARVVQLIHDAPGPVFSEDLLLVLKAGKPLVVEPTGLIYMAKTGKWDERPLVAMLARQGFGLLVVTDFDNNSHEDRYSPSMRAAIQSAYALSERIGEFGIYRPRHEP